MPSPQQRGVPDMRHIILHYHLFKNAGTSLDHILQQNFPGQWVTTEFTMAQPNTDQTAAWINDTPDAVAFSSHTMIGPVPVIEGVHITPIVLLRDPLARIASAYRFERLQDAETRGAKLARKHDLAGYVAARLAIKGDRQCRNFQTHRLASMVPGPASERDRALQAVDMLRAQGVLGLVSQFDTALQDLAKRIAPHHPDFVWKSVRANASASHGSDRLSQALQDLLGNANGDDIALLNYATTPARQRRPQSA